MRYKREKWLTPTRGEFSFCEMVEAIKQYIEEDNSKEYIVIVGGDSQSFYCNGGATRCITTVIVRRIGKGAQYYYYSELNPISKSLRQKIWNEALSVYETIIDLKDEGLTKDIIDIVPHIDVGEKGETRKLIKEVTGLFLSEGYDVKIKPFSIGASSVADKHTRVRRT